MQRIKSLALAAFLAFPLLLSACGKDSASTTAFNGDWFYCKGASGDECGVLDNDGVQYDAEGNYADLWSSSGSNTSATESGESYCSGKAGRKGKYTLSGARQEGLTLSGTVSAPGSSILTNTTFVIQGDVLTTSDGAKYKRVSPSRVSGPCS